MAEKTNRFARMLPWILVICGVIGVIASFIILNDKLKLASNPNYSPSCSLNPVVSCGSVMQSDQSHAFGFPNPFIGLVSFPVLITIGMGVLAGAKFKRWFWLGLQAGVTFGVLFVHWLFFQSVYRIQALCLYCIAVWMVTIAAFLYVTFYNFEAGNLKLPKNKAVKKAAAFKMRHHFDILIVWYLVITVLIVNHFWYYFKTIL